MAEMAGLARLDSSSTSIVLSWKTGIPQILHIGRRLREDEDLQTLRAAAERPVPQATLDETVPISLCPEFSSGFMGHPGLLAHRPSEKQSDWVGRFSLVDVSQSVNRIRFQCRDDNRELELVLEISLDPESEVIRMRSSITNAGDVPILVDWLAAPVIPLPYRLTEYLSFHGRWCAEFDFERLEIPIGMVKKENRRGRTSHEGFPGVFLVGRNTDENSGPVLAAHLAWSGNHRMIIERLPSGETQLQFGALYFPGEAMLQPGEVISTPELFLAVSSEGLNAASQAFHSEIRQKILRFPDEERPRPVTVNTWEALYFDHDWDKMRALVDKAAEIGAERFVLDDGWFLNRNSDNAGLGDWFPDPQKYPDGLSPLVDYVTSKGMEFGLWVEPEMVNPDSNLFRNHPDWALGIENVPTPLARNQQVLDLSNPEVTEYLFDCLSKLLSEYPIGYLKWDMNRDLVMPANREGRAAAYLQTKALYALIDRVRTEFPRVEIESCASGGGRVDMEVLKRTHRFWTSDSNDPVERARIQKGFSMFFPPEVMGAHIGPSWSHTTMRGFTPGFRAMVASFGHLGLELNLSEETQSEIPVLKEVVRRHKTDRTIWHSGDLYRLDHVDPNLIAFSSVTKDQSQARITALQIDRPRSTIPAPLRVPGLDRSCQYRVKLVDPDGVVGKANRGTGVTLSKSGLQLSGDALAHIGVQMPVLYAQSAVGLEIERLAA